MTLDLARANAAIQAERGEAYSIWPKPAAPDAFHGLAGDIVNAIEPHTEADPVALLGNILVAYGNAIGRAAYSVVESDKHYANEYVVDVGETSKGRKGTSWGHIRSIFKEADPTWASSNIKGGLSSGEGLIWSVRDPIEREEPLKDKGRVTGYETVRIDAGVLDKRLLVLETEFASTLKVVKREGNTLSTQIRQAWDSGDVRVLTKNSPAQATGAHISILGHITRDELRVALDRTEMANGFGNRFLWLCVKRSKVLPTGGNFKWTDHPQLQGRLNAALSFGRTPRHIKRDSEAERLWASIYGPLSEGQPGLLGSMVSRAEAHVLRLSMSYALLDCSDKVKAEHLTAALALWDYSLASCRHIFGDSLGEPVTDRILLALKEAPERRLSRTEISDLFGRHLSGGRLSAALTSLQALGRAKPVLEETAGRSIEWWVLT